MVLVLVIVIVLVIVLVSVSVSVLVLLFNLYINDLASTCRTCNVETYVDDSKLFLSFPKREMDSGLEYLTEDLLRVTSWCCHNHLLIHPDKTKFCLVGSQQMLSQISIPPLTFLRKTLHVEVAIKDLGVILDTNLSFTEHVDKLASKLVKKLCMLSRIRHLLDTSAMSIVINSLVFSQLFLLFFKMVWDMHRRPKLIVCILYGTSGASDL